MPRINQLPAASSVGATDVVAVDTQNGTKRVPKSTLFGGYYTAAEVDEAIQQSTASTTQNLTVYDDRVTPSAIDIPRARKTGKIVSIGGTFTVNVSLTSNQTTVFALPNDCAPPFNLYFAVIRESDGKAFIGQVSSSGNFNVLHGGGLSVGDVIYFGFTYSL